MPERETDGIITAVLDEPGEVLDGEGAARPGLVWRCVAARDLAAQAGRLAQRAASRDPDLVTRTERTMASVAALGHPAGPIELGRPGRTGA